MPSGDSSVSVEEYQLCYAHGDWAYFANVPPTEMWGDDWNDAPHDCNAGTPYVREGQAVVKVAYDADFELMGCGHLGSDQRDRFMSVEELNNRVAPWLVMPYSAEKVEVWAGITLAEFRKACRVARGQVYEAVTSS